jgi:hypothetical protein
MISTIAASLPSYRPCLMLMTRPTSTNFHPAGLTSIPDIVADFLKQKSEVVSGRSALRLDLRKRHGRELWCCAVQAVAGCVFLKIDVGVNHLPRSPTFILRREKSKYEVQLLELSKHAGTNITNSTMLADICYNSYDSQIMIQGKQDPILTPLSTFHDAIICD